MLAKGLEPGIYYLMTSNGEEIDLVIDKKTYQELLEVKYTKSSNIKMLSVVEKYMQRDDKGYLLYRGEEFPYKNHIKIINYTDYLKGL